MMYASTNADAALMWARLGNFFAALVAPAIFHFAAIYVGRARALRNVIAASWALCAILGILSTTSLLIPSVQRLDRKSTRLNSSHRCISYAVFCLKKKKYTRRIAIRIRYLG